MAVQTFIDGVDRSSVVQEGTSTHKLNKIGVATCKIPIDLAVDGIGKRMKIVDTDLTLNTIDHHGTILQVSDNDAEDTGTVEYTSYDPMEIWQWRPARDADGDFSKPSFITDFVTGPQIMQQILTNTVSAGAGPPTDAEGAMPIAMGSFAAGGANLSGAPADWPMTIAEIMSLLCETGELDVILTPIDAGGNMARVDCYNGNYGTDRSASVKFEYATGANNVRLIRRTVDATKLINKLWYYLGPKLDDQHWQGNITGDGYPDGAGGTLALPNPPGGDVTPVTGALGTLIAASRTAWLVRMEIRVYDAFGNEAAGAPLYARTWQNESTLRAQPKTLVHVTPERGVLPAFDIGDLVTVSAGAVFRGGFTGVQRVYERTYSWDEDGVRSIAEIQTSADQEAV